jgi:hypothetical protein
LATNYTTHCIQFVCVDVTILSTEFHLLPPAAPCRTRNNDFGTALDRRLTCKSRAKCRSDPNSLLYAANCAGRLETARPAVLDNCNRQTISRGATGRRRAGQPSASSSLPCRFTAGPRPTATSSPDLGGNVEGVDRNRCNFALVLGDTTDAWTQLPDIIGRNDRLLSY